MLRISVITLIRTDTTLDLSQKAEKGKSLLCRPESRFRGPQAMTLSRQFYDPGEGAAIGGSWRGPGPFQGRRAPFSGPAYRRGAAPAAFLLVRGSLAAPGVEEQPGAAPARAGLRRATRLAARLAASAWPRACFTLRSAAFTSRSLAAAPPPRASSQKDCQHEEALAPDSPTAPPRG